MGILFVLFAFYAYTLVVTIAIVLLSVPDSRWRFSPRRLLIVITLFAVLFGLTIVQYR